MSLLINNEKPNEYEQWLMQTASEWWLMRLENMPLEVVRRHGEVAWFVQQLGWNERTIRAWMRACGVWNQLGEIRKRRINDDSV